MDLNPATNASFMNSLRHIINAQLTNYNCAQPPTHRPHISTTVTHEFQHHFFPPEVLLRLSQVLV